MAEKQISAIPRHVAIIMDGNGRWAKKHLLPRSAGHRAGMERMTSLVKHIFSCGVQFVTLFALSTENLSRSEDEINALFSLFREYFSQNVKKLAEYNIRMKVIGDTSLLPDDVVEKIKEGEKLTQSCDGGTLLFAVAYGARREILRAVQASQGKCESEEAFSALLYTDGVPDPDFLIRTGNEKRLSNFLLWQCAYTELYFSEKMFPDFTDKEFDRALKDYASRERRFGMVGERS
jgi:undecaprenyl diphosphate synthase